MPYRAALVIGLGAALAGCSGSASPADDAGAAADAAVADATGDGGAVDAAGEDAAPQAPVISRFELAGSMAPSPTLAPTVLAHIEAADADDEVVDVCARTQPGQPAAGDPCWFALAAPMLAATPGPEVAFEVPVPLGYLPGSVAVHAWVRDQSGLVSAEVPSVSIVYDPGTPPQIAAVRATVIQAPCQQPVPADVNLARLGDDLFIHWSASFPEGTAQPPI
ncbi:MAG TPA: hypothetical protein VL172_10040, partial [Kofleriaceae bacterium]|nr:hypothetical protein [Kofleriaceae bacterium]